MIDNTTRAFIRLLKHAKLLPLLFIAACGGGGGGGDKTPTAYEGQDYFNGSISGRVVKGIVSSGTVLVNELPSGLRTASMHVETDGRFTESFPLNNGLVSLELVLNVSDHESIRCDYHPSCGKENYSSDFGEATSIYGLSPYDNDRKGIILKTYLSDFSANDFANGFNGEINISVLTSFAAAMADGMDGGANTANIQSAKQEIESIFGLSDQGIDIIFTSLIDVTDQEEWQNANDQVRYHSVINAAIIGTPVSINPSERYAAGISATSESYIILFNQILADLKADGELGGDNSEFAYAGDYTINIVNNGLNMNVTLSGTVNHQGSFSSVILNSSLDIYELLFKVSDSIEYGRIRGRFLTSRFHTNNSDSTSCDVEATIDSDGNITGNLTNGLSGNITGTATFSNGTELTPNSNANLNIERYKSLAESQVSTLDSLYDTVTSIP